ncbi:hypothetical protein M758_3G166000 [Ceratodon purpureus]|nr:hypothetical protein M758_3G166000 [Ceratodon purpureus]
MTTRRTESPNFSNFSAMHTRLPPGFIPWTSSISTVRAALVQQQTFIFHATSTPWENVTREGPGAVHIQTEPLTILVDRNSQLPAATSFSPLCLCNLILVPHFNHPKRD